MGVPPPMSSSFSQHPFSVHAREIVYKMNSDRATKDRAAHHTSSPPPRMEPTEIPQPVAPPSPAEPPPAPTVIIIGFGLPGRFVAEILDARKIPYAVVELNPTNARSIAACGKYVSCGDARDADLLKSAGVESAKLLVVTIPDEKIVLEVIQVARRINPDIRMMARCHYTSTGIKAERAGAFVVVVEEQIVALEFAKLIGKEI